MKRAVISVLKILIPLTLGIWLIYYFYDQLSKQQREELFTAFQQANLWWFLLAALLSWFSHLSRAWRWRYPVSYTHLRAHETVLDLVCRLLLEKKKHSNTS